MTISPTEQTAPGDFTPDAYAALLDQFVARGYQVRGYADALPDQAHLILRHDLDMSIQAARATADIEAKRGMKAHYFVLMRTEMYNPWSAQGRADLGAIADAGHDIGLHLDASLYPDDLDALDDACATECDALAQVLGRPVNIVSLHRPQAGLLGLKRSLGGRPHSYQPRFFRDIGYCSDSRGAWRHGHPCDHPAVAEGRALQLLTHPIWWSSDGDAIAKLESFASVRDKLLRSELAANCEPYRAVRKQVAIKRVS